MTDLEVGWLAGIIEGEGTIAIPKSDAYPSVRVEMCDKDIIDRLQTITDMGSVRPRKTKQAPHHKDKWLWCVCARREVLQLLLAITPLMGDRRLARIQDAVEALAREPRRGPPPVFPCGTRAAANRHYAHGEKPCEPCRLALNEDQKARKLSKN